MKVSNNQLQTEIKYPTSYASLNLRKRGKLSDCGLHRNDKYYF